MSIKEDRLKNEYIVGFHSGHDCSYAVLKNGLPIIHEEYERISRIKEGNGDGLKLFFDRNPELSKEVSVFTHCCHAPGVRELGDVTVFDSMLKQSSDGGYYEIGHHLAHAAHAHYSNLYERSLIIVVDAGGWNIVGTNYVVSSVTVWRGEKNKIEPVDIFSIHDFDIGGMWASCLEPVFGLSSGPPIGNQAGTIMAMAAIGKESAFSKEIYDSFFAPQRREQLFSNMKKYILEKDNNVYNVAKGIQDATERAIKAVIAKYIKPDDENICFSGGVALNSVCVGKVFDWFPTVKTAFVPMAPYDGGLSIGTAQYVYHHIQNNPLLNLKDFVEPYLGVKYTIKEIDAAISSHSNSIDVQKNINDSFVIEEISANKIVSVFNGKSESGRRALGNRSILADPRDENMKQLINDKVKHRQWFRPFAPSILEEETKNWFIKDTSSPYMGIVLSFKEEVKNKVPAVVHIDGTGRLQTVTESINPWYYKFLKLWKNKTGVPILLNTSFNDREPIVETPEDAIACFLKTSIDYLYFPEFGILVRKKEI